MNFKIILILLSILSALGIAPNSDLTYISNQIVGIGAQQAFTRQIDFGTVAIGASQPMTIELTCNNNDVCMLDRFSAVPGFPFKIVRTSVMLGTPILRGQAILISLSFEPTSQGGFQDELQAVYCVQNGAIPPPQPPPGSVQAQQTCYIYQFILTGTGFRESPPIPPSPPPVNPRPLPTGPDPVDIIVSGAGGVGAALLTNSLLNKQALAPRQQLPKSGFTTAINPNKIVAATAVGLSLALFPYDQLIVRFHSSIELEEAATLVQPLGGVIVGEFPPVNAYLIEFPAIGSLTGAAQKISELNRIQALIESSQSNSNWVIKNYLGQLETNCDLCSLDPEFMHAYETIKLIDAWEYLDNAGVKPKRDVNIGIIDTGLHGDHIEFERLKIPGKSYLSLDEGKEREEPWLKLREERANDKSSPHHGTWVTGIIGAASNGNQMNGVIAGFTDRYHLLVYKTDTNPEVEIESTTLNGEDLPEEFLEKIATIQSPLSSVLDGIAEAARTENADIINISMGWHMENLEETRGSRDLDVICKIFKAYMGSFKDVLFVTSAGNSGISLERNSCAHAPGGVDVTNNITVGATNQFGTALSHISNRGSAITLTAPGEDVYTTSPKTRAFTIIKHGTSFAAPMVTGTAAMIKAIDPSISPAQIKSILTRSATGPNRVLNALEAVKLASTTKRASDKRGFSPIAVLVGIITSGGIYAAIAN